ncbi:MAG: class I SAM-dependent methyltransferase [Chitinophagaceae bacterium]|nr:class I SAM-dependent methyltransferase [Chitinophagaceae bacterium]
MAQSLHYPGNELELFQEAHRWKSYLGQMIQPHIKGKVLEAGAGIGGTTPYLMTAAVSQWTLLEPDPEMADELIKKKGDGQFPAFTQVIKGTLSDLANETFDTILYIDVLEHIENDQTEFNQAIEKLNPGGRIIILSPALSFLYSPFDKAIGHHRRYDRKSLMNLAPAEMKLIQLRFLDLFGMILSLGNKWILKKPYPSRGQIQFWDKTIVPLSKVFDKLTRYWRGRSILGIWEKS